jgi:hypothetical protein
MNVLQKLWQYCPKPLKRKSHTFAKLALTMHLPRNPDVKISFISNPERIVVAVYALALAFPLLVVAIARFPLLGPVIAQAAPYPFGTYAIFLPLSITYFGPLLMPFGLGSTNSATLLEPYGFLVFLGSLALIVFYPVVSYYLWYRYRVAWILSFTASVVTIGLETYAVSLSLGAAALWVFGVAVNLSILYLLWRCKRKFFNNAE